MTIVPATAAAAAVARRRLVSPSLFAFAHLRQSCCRYSTFPNPPVDLPYEVHGGPIDPDAEHGPLIMTHGLFGQKRNFTSWAKQLSTRLDRPVICVDLRNFGDAPHSPHMDYLTFANDMLHFCRSHKLRNITLFGHSMGGKASMTLALHPETPKDLVKQLIIADIAPSRGRLSPEFPVYIDAFIDIEKQGKIKTRKEAFEALESVEKSPLIRQFLLTNLAQAPEGEPVKFRIPLEYLKSNLEGLGDFPYQPGERKWDGPALFIRGTKSNYIKLKNVEKIRQFFPQMQLVELEAGHWVHYDKPKEFGDIIVDFVLKH